MQILKASYITIKNIKTTSKYIDLTTNSREQKYKNPRKIIS